VHPSTLPFSCATSVERIATYDAQITRYRASIDAGGDRP
jgi:hypothetical protein